MQIHLDPAICYFALIPLVFVLLCAQILRMNLMTLLNGPQSTGPQQQQQITTTNTEVSTKKYENALRHSTHFKNMYFLLTDAKYYCSNRLLNKTNGEIGSESPPELNPMDALSGMNDPSKQMGAMKGQLIMIVLHGLTGYWVSHLFSGFIVAKVPFQLSYNFKQMTQRGIDVVHLDPSYVSALSIYFIMMVAASPIISLIQYMIYNIIFAQNNGKQEEANSQISDNPDPALLMMGGGMPQQQSPFGQGAVDFQKIFLNEINELEHFHFEYNATDVLERLRYLKNRI